MHYFGIPMHVQSLIAMAYHVPDVTEDYLEIWLKIDVVNMH